MHARETPPLPRRLRPGDRIGVVTPSWPIRMSPSPAPMVELERGLEVLRSLGLDPALSPNALADTGYAAGTPQQRADDLNAMFADPDIRAIVASHGGHVANGVLPLLDWESIAANPKVLLGFSNMATLLLAAHAVTGMVTFHGPMVIWRLGQDPDPYEVAELSAMLIDGRTGPIVQREPWVTVRDRGPAEGTLIGPGLGLRGLAGTRYSVPMHGDVILFFETMVDAPGITDAWLRHLVQMGVFRHVRGVLLGSDGAVFTGGSPDVPFADILQDVTADYDFTIVACDDFGHGTANTVLPIGATARLDPNPAQLSFPAPFVR